jgi:D-arabinose 1-dehydrogenase-like Zn-dependent alcohol dehydrogenase
MVRIGVVGFGGSGTRHALAFSKLPGVTVSSVVDPIQGSALARRIGATFYKEDEDFLQAQNFDALFIATPDAPEPLDAVKVVWAAMMMDYPPVDALWERPLGLDDQEHQTISASGASRIQ